MVTVAIAGKFSPIHRGHIDHIKKAAQLGDRLLIITHPDSVIKEINGQCWLSLPDRITMLKALMQLYGINGEVVISTDGDGGCDATLRQLKPDIFAKGGDRTPENMPLAEIEICREIGCEIIYGIGNLLGSSSQIMVKETIWQ